jgi:hypothetical protein
MPLHTYVNRWTFEPLTRTVTELFVNQAYCRLAALPVDELLARVARKDLPPHLSRIEHLAHVLAGLHAQVDPGSGADDGLEYLWWQVRWPLSHALSSSPSITRASLRDKAPALCFSTQWRNESHAVGTLQAT